MIRNANKRRGMVDGQEQLWHVQNHCCMVRTDKEHIMLESERVEVHYHIWYGKGANYWAYNTCGTLFPTQQDISTPIGPSLVVIKTLRTMLFCTTVEGLLGLKHVVNLETVYHIYWWTWCLTFRVIYYDMSQLFHHVYRLSVNSGLLNFNR